ncbi:MAG: regulatory protein GemA [Desulfobacteraceae bacterium]|nr:regulatory protein GemA [Desulfobacteraceae bacterium]
MRAAGWEAPITKAQIKYIQALRRGLGIDDELYDAMKESVGVSSTTELDNRQFDVLLKRMKQVERQQDRRAEAKPAGKDTWKPLHKSAKASGMHRKPAPEKEAMVRKIEAILADRELPWSYADGIARKMFAIEKLTWCDADQTFRVLQALAVYQRRHGGRKS